MAITRRRRSNEPQHISNPRCLVIDAFASCRYCAFTTTTTEKWGPAVKTRDLKEGLKKVGVRLFKSAATPQQLLRRRVLGDRRKGIPGSCAGSFSISLHCKLHLQRPVGKQS